MDPSVIESITQLKMLSTQEHHQPLAILRFMARSQCIEREPVPTYNFLVEAFLVT